ESDYVQEITTQKKKFQSRSRDLVVGKSSEIPTRKPMTWFQSRSRDLVVGKAAADVANAVIDGQFQSRSRDLVVGKSQGGQGGDPRC
ncbi:hypothetical protein, partial [Picosynechococcus sp. PCC 7002]|uniref:hypothetical protein n=1 Tax=Picosynechococcus sp. (strain ATCC 27264 / PCC 7002 / PR-6) TaxID=32049 RepID=UPI0020CB620E